MEDGKKDDEGRGALKRRALALTLRFARIFADNVVDLGPVCGEVVFVENGFGGGAKRVGAGCFHPAWVRVYLGVAVTGQGIYHSS